jgi:hypothetical protein
MAGKSMSILIISDDSAETHKLLEVWTRHWGGNVVALSAKLTENLDISLQVLQSFGTIVLLPSDVYPAIKPSLQQSLVEYVRMGGSFVCLPYTAWSCRTHGNHILDEILPVAASQYFENEMFRLDASSRLPLPTEEYDIQFIVPPLLPVTEEHFLNSGEELHVRSGARVRIKGEVNGTAIPIVVLRQLGNGTIVYVNLCPHGIQRHPSYWESTTDSVPELAFEYLRIASSYANIVSQRSPSLELVRFVWEFAVRFLKPNPFQESGNNLARPVAQLYAPYGQPYNPLRLFLPPEDEFESLSHSDKLIVCRALCTVLTIGSFTKGSPILKEEIANVLIEQLSRIAVKEPIPASRLIDLRDNIQYIVNPSNEWKGYFGIGLTSYLLRLISGMIQLGWSTRTSSGEVDAIFRNESIEPKAKTLGDRVVVEAKNWSGPVGAKEVRDFLVKVQEIGATTGVFFSSEGFTGSFRMQRATA